MANDATPTATVNDLHLALEALAQAAETERKSSTAYKTLFSNSHTLEHFLRDIELSGSQTMLDGCSVLEAKHGIRITREIMDFLLAVPYLSAKLEKQIEQTQGMACCVDKAFKHLADELQRLIDAAPRRT